MQFPKRRWIEGLAARRIGTALNARFAQNLFDIIARIDHSDSCIVLASARRGRQSNEMPKAAAAVLSANAAALGLAGFE